LRTGIAEDTKNKSLKCTYTNDKTGKLFIAILSLYH